MDMMLCVETFDYQMTFFWVHFFFFFPNEGKADRALDNVLAAAREMFKPEEGQNMHKHLCHFTHELDLYPSSLNLCA